jgi:hypothetical protein
VLSLYVRVSVHVIVVFALGGVRGRLLSADPGKVLQHNKKPSQDKGLQIYRKKLSGNPEILLGAEEDRSGCKASGQTSR